MWCALRTHVSTHPGHHRSPLDSHAGRVHIHTVAAPAAATVTTVAGAIAAVARRELGRELRVQPQQLHALAITPAASTAQREQR